MIFQKTMEELQTLMAVYTATEIHQQPDTWLKTIQQVEEHKAQLKQFIAQVTSNEDYDIVLTGAGTSEFVGNALFSHLNQITNFKAKSYATTDIVATPENYLSRTKPTLLISFGRSGNSPESIGAVQLANEIVDNIYQLFITCNEEGALSKAAKEQKNTYALNLTKETHDKSFAMTSSFSNMYLAALLCFHLEDLDKVKTYVEEVIRSGQKFLTEGYQFVQDIVQNYNFERIVYLGSNSLKGVAQESALKMLELTAGRITTMFDTPLGFRHGPKSIVNDKTLVVVYTSDDPYTYQYEVDLIKEMCGQRKENKIAVIANHKDTEIQQLADYYYAFENKDHLNSVYLGLDYILIAQVTALMKSLSLGMTPDNPFPGGFVNRVVQGVTLYPYQK